MEEKVVVKSPPKSPFLAGVLAFFFPFGAGQLYNNQYRKALVFFFILAGLVTLNAQGDAGQPFLGLMLGGFLPAAAWLLTLTRNHLIDQYRKTKWEKKSRDEFNEHLLSANSRSGPEESVMIQESKKIVWEAFNHLTPEIRMAIILRDIQGKKYEEIAEIMELPLGTIKSRVNRGRLQLAKILREKKERENGL